MMNTKKIVSVIIMTVVIVLPAGAADLNITTFTNNNDPNYQTDDTVQAGIVAGVIWEYHPYGEVWGPPPAAADAVDDPAYPFLYTLGVGTEWTGGSIDFVLTGRYEGNRVLDNITIYVYAADNGRRFYDFQVQYSTVDAPAAFIEIVDPNLLEEDDPGVLPEGTGSEISITNIGVSNIHTVRIWSDPWYDGESTSLATCINEVDVNFDGPIQYQKGDLNKDCIVDFEDFAMFASQWLDCTHFSGSCF